MTAPTEHEAFSPESTAGTLVRACSQVGLPTGGTLLRIGENAIYSLSEAAVVVRIARRIEAMPAVMKELRVARWLDSSGYPGARPALQSASGPIVVDGHPVTFWDFVRATAPKPNSQDLGALLQRLHSLPQSDDLALPMFDPFIRAKNRLLRPPAVASEAAVSSLQTLLEDLASRFERLTFALSHGAIHGDAHTGNLMRGADGQVIVIDFETFANGPREWDLVWPAVAVSIGWLDEEAYQAFVGAYGGFDVRQWSGFPVLRDAKRLTMTTWLMQLADDPRALAEFRDRVGDIQRGDEGRTWRSF